MKQNQRTYMQICQNKNQGIELFYLSVKIKSTKGKLFQFSGEGESIGQHMGENAFGKQDL